MSESKLMKYFSGKLVSITSRDVKTRTGNMSFVGFLLDEDEENFYLGEIGNGEIEAAIPKIQNAGITVLDENDLMDQITVPEDQGVQ